MYGFHGRILRVDLSDQSFAVSPLDRAGAARLLGGKGLATHLLLEENPAHADPLGPENRLIFATGPLTQSAVWGASRYGVYTRSPLTGCYAESYSGGKAPEALDAAGYDAVVISGVSSEPVVLAIHPEGVEFHSAGELWGMDTYQTEDEAKARFGLERPGYRTGAVVIGPAGENQVRFAVIENDYWRSAGRAGTGAVMGAKRLKAVVFSGDRRRELADPEGIAAHAKEFMKQGRDTPGVKAYKARGTTMMVAMLNTAGAFPAKYWSQGTCDHWEKLSGDTFHEEHKITPHACLKCFMACGRMATVQHGRHKGLTIEGPEYETIYAFGGLCMIEDMGEIAWLNDICDRLGMDTITAGNLVAMAMEAGERGRIDRKIPYGDPDATAELLQEIAHRKCFGEALAYGARDAAKALGMEDLAVHVKGMEPAGYDPRVLKGMGLAYGTSDRGACHLRATFYKPELAGMIPREQIEGKAELFVDFEDRLTIFDTLVLCRFYRDLYSWEQLEEVVRLATGLDAGKGELQERARNVRDLARRFNLREGVTAEDDRLPRRLHDEPLPSGHAISEEDMETMLADYYRLRGWDEKGRPPGE